MTAWATTFLPNRLQDHLRYVRFLARAWSGHFSPGEPEAEMLPGCVRDGDWVIDVGANVGQYALLLSRLVGPSGRVVAIEPMSATVATLASVAKLAPSPNISILNVAASDSAGTVSFDLPRDEAGLRRPEMARISPQGQIPVLAIAIDALRLPHRIALAKIDTEGHELAVLRGMRTILERDHPLLIVEDGDPSVALFLKGFGYDSRKTCATSPNVVYYHGSGPELTGLRGSE